MARLYDEQDDRYEIARLITGEQPRVFDDGTPRVETQPAPTTPDLADYMSPYGKGGGWWDERYEWVAPEGSPRVSDLLGEVGNVSWLTGFNWGKWGSGERGTESAKNTFGMIASRFDPSDPTSLDRMLADPRFRQFFPNARKVGDDKIDFGDGKPVDVWVAWEPGKGGKAWAYQAEPAYAAPPSSSASGFGRAPSPSGLDPKNLIHPLTGEPISEDAYMRLAEAGYVDPVTGRPKPYRVRSRVRDLLAEPTNVYDATTALI